jgi:hypothetical protein
MQAEGVFEFDNADHDVEAALLRHGTAFVRNIGELARCGAEKSRRKWWAFEGFAAALA